MKNVTGRKSRRYENIGGHGASPLPPPPFYHTHCPWTPPPIPRPTRPRTLTRTHLRCMFSNAPPLPPSPPPVHCPSPYLREVHGQQLLQLPRQGRRRRQDASPLRPAHHLDRQLAEHTDAGQRMPHEAALSAAAATDEHGVHPRAERQAVHVLQAARRRAWHEQRRTAAVRVVLTGRREGIAGIVSIIIVATFPAVAAAATGSELFVAGQHADALAALPRRDDAAECRPPRHPLALLGTQQVAAQQGRGVAAVAPAATAAVVALEQWRGGRERRGSLGNGGSSILESHLDNQGECVCVGGFRVYEQ